MYIFIAEKGSTHIQCHATNDYKYIEENVKKWCTGRDGTIYPYTVQHKKGWSLKDYDPKRLYALVYKTSRSEQYDILAISRDWATLKKVGKTVKQPKTNQEYHETSYRVVACTSNYLNESINGDSKVSEDIKNKFGRVQIVEAQDNRKRKFTYSSQADGSYILYDEYGKWYATCDDWKELQEELRDANAEV